MSCCQYVALLPSMLTVFAPNEWKVEYLHVFQLQYQIQLFKLYIFDTEIKKARIFKIKLHHIVVVFPYCAVCQPVWDVIFAIDHSNCSVLCVLDPLDCLGPCSSQ